MFYSTQDGTYAVISERKDGEKRHVVRFDNPVSAFEYYNTLTWNKEYTNKVVENYGTPLEQEL